MKRKIMVVCALAFLVLPGAVTAQEHPGMHGGQMGSGQHMMGQMGQHNMDMMNQMMDEMHQIMGSHQMTPEQQRQMQQMDEPDEPGDAGSA